MHESLWSPQCTLFAQRVHGIRKVSDNIEYGKNTTCARVCVCMCEWDLGEEISLIYLKNSLWLLSFIEKKIDDSKCQSGQSIVNKISVSKMIGRN